MNLIKELNPINLGLSLLGLNRHDSIKDIKLVDTSVDDTATFEFGPMVLSKKFIFMEKSSMYCIVPPTPIMPGHVILVPKRKVKRYNQLVGIELFDISLSTKYLSTVLQQATESKGCTIYIQVCTCIM